MRKEKPDDQRALVKSPGYERESATAARDNNPQVLCRKARVYLGRLASYQAEAIASTGRTAKADCNCLRFVSGRVCV